MMERLGLTNNEEKNKKRKQVNRRKEGKKKGHTASRNWILPEYSVGEFRFYFVTIEHFYLRLSASAELVAVSDNCVREKSFSQRLEHWISIRTNRVRIPRKAENFITYGSLLSYDFHVVRWWLVGDSLFRQKRLHIIINDDLLERAVLRSIICLGRLRVAWSYIFNL